MLTDPTNIAFDEVLYPGLVEESMDIELAELKEDELKVRLGGRVAWGREPRGARMGSAVTALRRGC